MLSHQWFTGVATLGPASNHLFDKHSVLMKLDVLEFQKKIILEVSELDLQNKTKTPTLNKTNSDTTDL
jgi:hypothetical protein